jgi:hypothetical protein
MAIKHRPAKYSFVILEAKILEESDAEDRLDFAFSAGMSPTRHKNNADSVVRPQLGGL